MGLFPKLVRLSCRYESTTYASSSGFNCLDGGDDDLEPQISFPFLSFSFPFVFGWVLVLILILILVFCFLCEAARGVCLGINAESKCEPRLSGPSIRRTIAGAVSAVDLRCNLGPATGS